MSTRKWPPDMHHVSLNHDDIRIVCVHVSSEDGFFFGDEHTSIENKGRK